MDLYSKSVEKALKLIAKKRYTSAEIKEKIRNFVGKKERLDESLSLSEQDVNDLLEKVLARLVELGYVNDQQYAKDFVADRMRFKPRGKFMIRRELKKKGLERDEIDGALSGVEEGSMAMDLLKKKSSKWKCESVWKEREKAFRFLASKGFSPDTIYKVVDSHYNRHS